MQLPQYGPFGEPMRLHFRRLSPLPLVTALLALTPCLTLVTARVSRAAATPEEVKKAIEKGQAYLISKQLPAGRWETADKRDGMKHDWGNMQGDAWGGYTALCTYALLASGEKPQDAKIAAAIEFLKKADIIGIYSIGMRCQVWYLVPPDAAEPAGNEKVVAEGPGPARARHQRRGAEPRALGLWRRPRHDRLQQRPDRPQRQPVRRPGPMGPGAGRC